MNPVRSLVPPWRDPDLGGATSYGMNIIKIIGYILAISFGVFMIVYGERDDSPGGQMLGLVMAIVGIWGIVRGRRKSAN